MQLLLTQQNKIDVISFARDKPYWFLSALSVEAREFGNSKQLLFFPKRQMEFTTLSKISEEAKKNFIEDYYAH
ncbi:hypothetical protein ACTXT7_001835 [Hymenolepis weldensis]